MFAFTKKYYLVWLKNDPKDASPKVKGCLGKVVLWPSNQTEFGFQRLILKIKIKALENFIYFNVLKCYSKGIFQIKGLLFFDFTKMFNLYIHFKNFLFYFLP